MKEAVSRLITHAYHLPEPQQCSPIAGGLINRTFDIDDVWILQHVNPIFGPAVNDDIAALTEILRSKGVCVPMICRTCRGAYCVEGSVYGLEPGPWRLMSKLPGKTHHKVQNIEQIRALTIAVAQFHGALDGVRYDFKHTRPGVHDFDRHRTALEKALYDEKWRSHRLWQHVDDLFKEILGLIPHLDTASVLSCDKFRVIHGDPKISNFLFSGETVTGVVDLDTMALSRVAFDIGDAVRSWCNPCAEDVEPDFNREYAREVMGLYQEEAVFLHREERRSLEASAAFISLELSMRFARDAICEDYFGFNPEIGHGEHSLMRARAMKVLCGQMLEHTSV